LADEATEEEIDTRAREAITKSSQLAEQQGLIDEQIEEDIDRLSRETISTVRFTMHLRVIMRLTTIL
jgi:hypothetical protein